MLTTKKGRDGSGRALVEGWKLVEELLASSWTVERVIVDVQRMPPNGRSLLGRCAERSVEVRSGAAADLRALSDVREDQGIIAVTRLPRLTIQDVPASGDLLLLDGVADPGNVGTLIRTADWFGLTAVVLGPGSASPDNPKVLRSTMGSLFRVPTIEVEDLADACRSLVGQRVELITADVEGGSWPKWAPRGRVALILGSEAHGVSAVVREMATRRVSIPREGRAESLNVAAAGAILMSSLAGQRHA